MFSGSSLGMQAVVFEPLGRPREISVLSCNSCIQSFLYTVQTRFNFLPSPLFRKMLCWNKPYDEKDELKIFQKKQSLKFHWFCLLSSSFWSKHIFPFSLNKMQSIRISSNSFLKVKAWLFNRNMKYIQFFK